MIEEKKYELGSRNITIALLTDLHFSVDYNLSILSKLIDNLYKNKPDYICLSGDIIDAPNMIYKDEINLLKEFIKDLSSIAPVIISLGNHDIGYKQFVYDFEGVNSWFLELNKMENVYYLNNKSLVRGDICFTGYNPPGKYYEREKNNDFIEDIDKSIDMSKKYFNILLCHSPINVLKESTIKNSKQINKADLILSGHMHNGMVFRLFDQGGNVGWIGPQKKFFPKYARNIVTKKLDNHEIDLVISGGIVKVSTANSKKLHFLNKFYPISVVYVKI